MNSKIFSNMNKIALTVILNTSILLHSTLACQDSLTQWKENERICGFSIKRNFKDTDSSHPDIAPNFQNNSNTLSTMTENSTGPQSIEHSSKLMSYNGSEMKSIQNVTIKLEDFECCLKNIIIYIRNKEQNQKCLKSFYQCINEIKNNGKCSVRWGFYINLVIHDERFMMVIVFILVSSFLTVMICFQKCNGDSESLILIRGNNIIL